MNNYGFLSILPIIITISIAILTRNVIISLFIGVFSAVFILAGPNPINVTLVMLKDFVLVQLQDSYNMSIILLLIFIGGFVSLIENSGGAEAFARSVVKFVNSKTKTQISAWIGGILVFFSELGTPLIVGPIFSPLFEKMKMSKEKLAWILDTTSSPICILIPFIGWGVYSMGLIQTELDALNITFTNDWGAFINALPFQFYAILCIILVPMVALYKRDFGPMVKAETLARDGKFSSVDDDIKTTMIVNNNVSPLILILPLVILFLTTFGILIPKGFPVKQVSGGEFRLALMTGYLFAAILMVLLMKYYKISNLKDGFNQYIKGTSKLFSCNLMLILAWSLSAAGKELGTSEYIVKFASENLPSYLVPAIIFLIGALMSFATGTSWGTFAIMFPIAIPMAIHLDASLFITIAAVLSGGLFGDHCSFVSDTTILSATGAGCSLMDHMWTQFPYALLCGVISFISYIFAGITENLITLPISIIILIVSYLIIGKIFGKKIK